jgi:hypothetical protein
MEDNAYFIPYSRQMQIVIRCLHSGKAVAAQEKYVPATRGADFALRCVQGYGSQIFPVPVTLWEFWVGI